MIVVALETIVAYQLAGVTFGASCLLQRSKPAGEHAMGIRIGRIKFTKTDEFLASEVDVFLGGMAFGAVILCKLQCQMRGVRKFRE